MSRFEIVTREDFSDVTYLLECYHPLMAKAAQAGQFVIVMLHEHGERIPLTIADFDRKKGTITLVIPSHFDKVKKVACVGGGLGVAPIFPHARAFKEAGAYVIGIVGFRTNKLIFWEEKFKSFCDEFIICTDDGSAGIKGMITEGIKLAIQKHSDIDEFVAIGPPVMMKGCAEATRPHHIKTIVSLNPLMVDGTGMCGGCRVKLGDQVKFACVDGPDFDGHKVDFDDLMTRLKRFAREEKTALERWSASCRMREQVHVAPAFLMAEVAPEVLAAGGDPLGLPDPFDDARGG
ncbi:MAG: sulfide/dihydroorotate dehydrogenase-like FAD/NAD-binding protein [Pseudomonadota bacterium]